MLRGEVAKGLFNPWETERKTLVRQPLRDHHPRLDVHEAVLVRHGDGFHPAVAAPRVAGEGVEQHGESVFLFAEEAVEEQLDFEGMSGEEAPAAELAVAGADATP